MSGDAKAQVYLDGEELEVTTRNEPALVLDPSHGDAALFKALAECQGKMETVGKDGRNTEGRGYSYATAENMIRATRKPMASCGIAFMSTWHATDPEDGAEGDIGNQFVGAVVEVHWILTHAEGGYLQGTANMAAICSRRRPPDKAVAATLTYLRGFILRDLLNMDREETEEQVDERHDQQEGYQHRGRGKAKAQQDRTDEESEEDRKRREYETRVRPLREKVLALAKELEDKTRHGFALQRSAAKVPQRGRLSEHDLRKFIAWAEAKLDEVDGHTQAPPEEDEDDVPDWMVSPPAEDEGQDEAEDQADAEGE